MKKVQYYLSTRNKVQRCAALRLLACDRRRDSPNHIPPNNHRLNTLSESSRSKENIILLFRNTRWHMLMPNNTPRPLSSYILITQANPVASPRLAFCQWSPVSFHLTSLVPLLHCPALSKSKTSLYSIRACGIGDREVDMWFEVRHHFIDFPGDLAPNKFDSLLCRVLMLAVLSIRFRYHISL
jgi:hypothetical protein